LCFEYFVSSLLLNKHTLKQIKIFSTTDQANILRTTVSQAMAVLSVLRAAQNGLKTLRWPLLQQNSNFLRATNVALGKSINKAGDKVASDQ
jgi:hypothetical protein